MPKISVLMPVYNTQEKHLKEAIESVLTQTFSDFEFIILNDCSTDNNVEKIVQFYTDKRIKYFKNEHNLGISNSRNRLLDLSNGEYIAVMDHDDISLAERFTKQVNFLDNNPQVGVVSCWTKYISKQKTLKLPITNSEIQEHLLFNCGVTHSATMLRKSILIENNIKYENEFTPAEDYALYCRLIGKTEFYNIPEVLFIYRDHLDNTTHKQSKKMAKATLSIQNFARNEHKELWLTAQQRSTTILRINIFKILPILKIRRTINRINLSLFGLLPLLSIRIQRKIEH